MISKDDLLRLIRGGAGGAEVFARLEEAVAAPLARTAEDVELLLAYTQRAWIADQRNPAATRVRDGAQRLIEMVPDFADGYRLLGFAHLARKEYREAYLTLSAVKTITMPANFDSFRALARNLMTGSTRASFDLGGARYTFDLTTHNAAATDSSAAHSVGLLTEWDELQHLARVLDRGKVRRIVEVGALLGNHSAFFLKALEPDHMTLIDADPANIPFIERTVFYHLPDSRPEIDVKLAFVAATTGEGRFGAAKVPRRTLQELTQGPVDFLKIDVDGGEMGVLAGAAPVIDASRPAVMIETARDNHDDVLAWFAARRYQTNRVFDHGAHRNVILLPQ
jgi:hypothetical protein